MNIDTESLTTEYQLLHLVYHRNYNQHRVARWWRSFNELHRHVRRVLKLLSVKKSSPALSLEIKYIVNKLIKKCYWEFNGIVALGQFVPLGLVLIGLLARINSLLLPGVPKKHEPIIDKQVDDKICLGEDIGEDMEQTVITAKASTADDVINYSATPVSIDDIFGSKPKKLKPKKQKKQKKSAIDNIFG